MTFLNRFSGWQFWLGLSLPRRSVFAQWPSLEVWSSLDSQLPPSSLDQTLRRISVRKLVTPQQQQHQQWRIFKQSNLRTDTISILLTLIGSVWRTKNFKLVVARLSWPGTILRNAKTLVTMPLQNITAKFAGLAGLLPSMFTFHALYLDKILSHWCYAFVTT